MIVSLCSLTVVAYKPTLCLFLLSHKKVVNAEAAHIDASRSLIVSP